MADTGSIQLTVRPDGVAVLTLDQPDSRANLLSKPLWAELEAALIPLAGVIKPEPWLDSNFSARWLPARPGRWPVALMRGPIRRQPKPLEQK
jgi:hypothetical protein